MHKCILSLKIKLLISTALHNLLHRIHFIVFNKNIIISSRYTLDYISIYRMG